MLPVRAKIPLPTKFKPPDPPMLPESVRVVKPKLKVPPLVPRVTGHGKVRLNRLIANVPPFKVSKLVGLPSAAAFVMLMEPELMVVPPA